MTGMDNEQFRSEIRRSVQELEVLRSRIAQAIYLHSMDDPRYQHNAQFITYLFSMMSSELLEIAGQKARSVEPAVTSPTAVNE